jgi:hypothetical protein
MSWANYFLKNKKMPRKISQLTFSFEGFYKTRSFQLTFNDNLSVTHLNVLFWLALDDLKVITPDVSSHVDPCKYCGGVCKHLKPQ